MSEKSVERSELLTLTSDIVAVYAANNAMPGAGLPGLLGTVFYTLSDLGAPAAEPEQEPAVPIKKSVSKKFITCLEWYASGLPDLADFLTPESLTPR